MVLVYSLLLTLLSVPSGLEVPERETYRIIVEMESDSCCPKY